MWWKYQNLNKPIFGKDGKTWEFLVWHDLTNGVYIQKIYFWNQDKTITGILELNEGNTLHIRKLKDKIKKIANDIEFRNQYLCQLKFPLEKNY